MMRFARYLLTTFIGTALLLGMSSSLPPALEGHAQTQTQEITIYQTTLPQVTRDFVLQFAREAFGMDAPTVSEDDEVFVLRQGEKILQVWKDSFAILFSDDDKLWNPDYKPKLAANAQEAVQQANAFLRQHNLLPPEASASTADLRSVKDRSGAGVPNHWKVTYKFELSLEGGEKVPIVGAFMELRIGDEGEIIGFDRNWRDLKPFEKRPLRSVQAAVELFQQKFCRQLSLSSHTPASALLVYLMDDALNVQKFVAPFYFFGLVSATDFSPMVTIESPADEPFLREGQEITFKASARFGTPPLGYAWYSVTPSLTDFRSQEAAFKRTLPVGTYILQVLTADKNGMFDFGQGVTVTVVPQGQPLKSAQASPTVDPQQDETGKSATIGVENTGELPICIHEIVVTRPDGTQDKKAVFDTLEPGKKLALNYPDDFPQGDVSQPGQYRVEIQLRGLEPLQVSFTRIPPALAQACRALSDNRVQMAEHQQLFELAFEEFVGTWVEAAVQYIQEVTGLHLPPSQAYQNAEPLFAEALEAFEAAQAALAELRTRVDSLREQFAAAQASTAGQWQQALQSLDQLLERLRQLRQGLEQALAEAKKGTQEGFNAFKQFQDEQFAPLVNGVRQAGQDSQKKAEEAVNQSLQLCPPER